MISQGSQFRVVSMGIVAENKPRGENEIRIWPIELYSELNDEVRQDSDVVEATGTKESGERYRFELRRSATVPAEWLGENNRRTSPDVRRGEQVFLWQSSDADKYYWTTLGRKKDLDLRRLETIVYAWSGDPNNEDTEFNLDNAYYFELSTHDKLVTFRTSQANGEKVSYLTQYNTGDGYYILEDSEENRFSIDSMEHHLRLENADESVIEINKTVANIFTKDEVNIRTDKYTLEATSSIDVKTSSYTEKSDTYKHSGGTVSWSSQSFDNTTDKYNRKASVNTVGGPVTYDSMNAFPAFTCGPGATASSGGGGGDFVGEMKGGLNHTEGKIKSVEMEVDKLDVGAGKFQSIEWSSASGPLP
ncbi:hypothetical protein [Vibrio phage vB_VmeM-Yong XC32]|nr:hypothetical protein [Vibrio phage vB_VmeM-Yong XC31]QAX96469.1 hypothetical protein [Vibrio phage vB_VmeM-Yong XC32]QAX96786.1 hypothetical protein [Vibrio phage vB_VmeM-Yong MS31]QAX97105.1 hypothetical protein [Vibrio phage vB_VmeM-Yong MS32]